MGTLKGQWARYFVQKEILAPVAPEQKLYVFIRTHQHILEKLLVYGMVLTPSTASPFLGPYIRHFVVWKIRIFSSLDGVKHYLVTQFV